MGEVRSIAGFGLALALLSSTAGAQLSEEWRDPSPDAPTAEEPPPEPEPAREARGATLKSEIPDLSIALLPPAFTFGGGLTAYFPFQGAGLGFTIEAYATEWLRLGAAYSIGLGSVGGELGVNNYAEAIVGLRLAGVRSERVVEVVREASTGVGRKWGTPAPARNVELRAWLPAYHAIFVEGGMITGYVDLERCLANCGGDSEDDDLEDAGSQLFIPFGGLRYLYFIHATSQRHKRLNRRLELQLYGHVITRPLNEPEAGLQWTDGRATQQHPLGGRGGFEIPLCLDNCGALTFEAGYLPSPGSVMFSVGFKKRI